MLEIYNRVEWTEQTAFYRFPVSTLLITLRFKAYITKNKDVCANFVEQSNEPILVWKERFEN